ncbi:hypothetical protein [Chitinophaga pinensis]|uniref:Uncharacterized protein n=1 Tax=Chitinophaga pinensis (strain ATCC 43595 / DSM 2588 / LMG 13176 / NBRC 15968 / NCIMB 11800 / UQM 2034) TaxID=485918 RepID=A0A979GB75_CHIPD|nr:hypothetical protein [Chitinophaga pinensis]ACU64148.1 hypothetical protein Cpin_6747 [Chitinophaga pinensis DSM 2588]
MEFDFPIPLFLTLKKELDTIRNDIEKEKAIWKTIRDTLSEAEMMELDGDFFDTFDSIHLSATDMSQAEQTLTQLVHKGASAHLMTNHELDAHNVGMLSQDIPIYNNEQLKSIVLIVRAAVIAGATVDLQKAYVLNGGMNALNYVCSYLGMGTTGQTYHLGEINYHTQEQIRCCYDIFPLLICKPGFDYPYHMFISSLKYAPEVTSLQENTILRIMALGWTPFSVEMEYLNPGIFNNIFTINPQWLGLLFPYEHEQLKYYIDAVKREASAAAVKILINGVTSSNKSRKVFRTFFSQKVHWFLKLIVTDMPEILFNLVQRNERDMLIPFLKYFKREIASLRDENNRTLLEYAINSKRVVENTIQLIQQAIPAAGK